MIKYDEKLLNGCETFHRIINCKIRSGRFKRKRHRTLVKAYCMVCNGYIIPKEYREFRHRLIEIDRGE